MSIRKHLGFMAAAGIALAWPVSAAARTTNSGIDLSPLMHNGGSVPWNIVVMLTVLTLLPALGTQTTPSNQTLIGLSLILTFFLMQPVGAAVHDAAIVPYEHGQIDAMGALDLASGPLRNFMLKYAREKDLSLFLELAKQPKPRAPDELSMRVVIPAYLISELKAGFQIGAALYLPFLVVDMAVAAITTSVGMLQLPPVVISTPLKILLFVMVDGWNLLVGSLMKSF